MPTVRIREDIYKRVTKLAVDTTLKMQTPVSQGAIIQMLLDLVLNDYKSRELITEYHSILKRKEA